MHSYDILPDILQVISSIRPDTRKKQTGNIRRIYIYKMYGHLLLFYFDFWQFYAPCILLLKNVFTLSR
jgi:hypothetical protein